MPVLNNFTAPSSATQLSLPQDLKNKFFIAFISSLDTATKQPWCPDVRRALPHINAAFSSSDGSAVALVEVGQRPEYVAWSNRPRLLLFTNTIPAFLQNETDFRVI